MRHWKGATRKHSTAFGLIILCGCYLKSLNVIKLLKCGFEIFISFGHFICGFASFSSHFSFYFLISGCMERESFSFSFSYSFSFSLIFQILLFVCMCVYHEYECKMIWLFCLVCDGVWSQYLWTISNKFHFHFHFLATRNIEANVKNVIALPWLKCVKECDIWYGMKGGDMKWYPDTNPGPLK